MAVVKQTEIPERFAWELRAEESEIERWRRQVAVAVRTLGGDPSGVETARLGVSELLSNVCKHVADRRCRLEVRREADVVLVQVFDHSKEAPAVLVPDWNAEHGRGLWLLRETTVSLGYTCTALGKWVWFTIPIQPLKSEHRGACG